MVNEDKNNRTLPHFTPSQPSPSNTAHKYSLDSYIQSTTKGGASMRNPKAVAQTGEGNPSSEETIRPKDPNTDLMKADKIEVVDATTLPDSGSLAEDFIDSTGFGGSSLPKVQREYMYNYTVCDEDPQYCPPRQKKIYE